MGGEFTLGVWDVKIFEYLQMMLNRDPFANLRSLCQPPALFPITHSLWRQLLVYEHHVLNPLSLHILPMLERLPRYLLQRPPVAFFAFIDTLHEALPSRRAISSLIPCIDGECEQSTLPQQSNGSVHGLERQISFAGTQSGANNYYIGRRGESRFLRASQISSHVLVVDVWPIPQRGRSGGFEKIGAGQSPDARFLAKLLAELLADDTVAGCDVQNGQGTAELFGDGRGGEVLLEELHRKSWGIAC